MTARSHSFVAACLGSALAACSVPTVAFTPAGDATVEPDPDGPCLAADCECTAATEATDCAAHEICDESGPGRACRCADAYELQGGRCVFAGAPRDPELDDPTAWTAVGPGVAIDPALPGAIDPGQAVIQAPGMCALSSLTQTFRMPPLARAEPLKLTVTHTGFAGVGLAIGVGRQWFHTRAAAMLRTESFCLGAGAYGGDVEFRIATFGAPACASASSVHVDHLAVEPAAAGECPAPGTALDGDFEQAGGWAFSGTGHGTGTIVAGAGENGSRGARLETVDRCSTATATGTVAIPDADHQAIELYWSGSPSARLALSLGGGGLATLVGDGAARRSRICVPSWARGNTTQLSLFVQHVSNNMCSTPVDRVFLLDSVTVVDEPACGTAAFADPGGERVATPGGPAPGWRFVDGIINDVVGTTATELAGAGARTGAGRLQLVDRYHCASPAVASAAFRVPAPTASAGPAVRFFANVATATSAAYLELGVLDWVNMRVNLDATPAFAERIVCVPPGAAGRPFELRFGQQPSGGGCIQPIPDEIVAFDDIEATTDASCPTQ